MSELLWKCPYCPSDKGWNAPSLHHCGDCGEIKPPVVTLQDAPSYIETLTPSKPVKSRQKGQKGASKTDAKQRGNKVSYDGFLFDSKIEYQRYLYLKECQQNGLITGLQVHPTYTLAPSVKLPASFLPKKTQGAITYTPDFSYRLGFMTVYEDTKGAYGYSKKNVANGKAGKPIVTEAARLRHKLFIAKMVLERVAFHFELVTVATKEIEGLERIIAA